MSQGPPQANQGVEAVFNYAAQRMAQGCSPAAVEQELMQKGLDPQSARTVIGELSQVKSQALRSSGLKNMGIGALFCIGGIVATVVTYAIASESGGGTYIIAYGPAIFGGIQFFRGLYQVATA
jgi:uncharacterized protein YjeT (DUF2065 family)